MFRYRGYGLVLESELALPDWPRVDGPPDVLVRIGTVPEQLDHTTAWGSQWSHGPDGFLVRLPNIGRFLVRNGREVIVEPVGGSSTELAFGFHSAAVGPLLHQRGRFVLHASVVEGASGGVAVAGHSGAGKSTTLLACLARGLRMVADDIAAVELDRSGRSARVHTGIGAVGAWPDTASHLQVPPEDVTHVRPGSRKLKVPRPATPRQCVPLKAVVVLHVHQDTDVDWQPVTGREKFKVLWSLTRGLRVAAAIDQVSHFGLASALAETVPMYRLGRPHGTYDALETIATRVAAVVQS